jgi:hypothetical protein
MHLNNKVSIQSTILRAGIHTVPDEQVGAFSQQSLSDSHVMIKQGPHWRLSSGMRAIMFLGTTGLAATSAPMAVASTTIENCILNEIEFSFEKN